MASSEVVFGKEVMLQTHGLDKYKRTLIRCVLVRWHPRQLRSG